MSSATETEITGPIADPVTEQRKKPIDKEGLKLRGYFEKRCEVKGNNIDLIVIQREQN